MKNLIIVKKNNQIDNYRKKVVGGAIIRNFVNKSVPSNQDTAKPNVVSFAKVNGPKKDTDNIKLGRDTVMHDGSGVSQINENLKKLNFANMKKNNIKFIV